MGFLLLLLVTMGAIYSTGETSPLCQEHSVLAEFYRSLHRAMEGLKVSGHEGTVQTVEMLDVGLPLSYSDFNPGDTKESAKLAVEKAFPLVDRMYFTASSRVDSMSAAYGHILNGIVPKGIDSTANAMRTYLQEEVLNPELVMSNQTVPRFLLYDYYRSNYLHMKISEDSAIDDICQELSLEDVTKWGQSELLRIESDSLMAFYKWQMFGYKYEVEGYLSDVAVDSIEEHKHLSRLSVYKSVSPHASSDIHVKIYPFTLLPDDWYHKLKTNPLQSVDELMYRKAVLLTQQSMLLLIKDMDNENSDQLNNSISNIEQNLVALQQSANSTMETLLEKEANCYTAMNASACSEINNFYTNFRYTMDHLAEHYAQVDYLKSLLVNNFSHTVESLIVTKSKEIEHQLMTLDAKISVAVSVERKEMLDTKSAHKSPLVNSCSDDDEIKFSFSSSSVSVPSSSSCAEISDNCSYLMVPPGALENSLWGVQSCSVDSALKSLSLYERLMDQMRNASFYVTASLTKVMIERPWFDTNLFEETQKYKMVQADELVSPGPLMSSNYFKRVISTGRYILPQYVHALVLAHDITIHFPGLGSWDFSEYDVVVNTLMKYAFAEELAGNFGPFSFEVPESGLGHNFRIARKKLNGGIVITLPGAQLVGYIMNSVPKFPSDQNEVTQNRTECECCELYQKTGIVTGECSQWSACVARTGCPAGYYRSSDSHTCYDVDECEFSLDNCEHSCHNTVGSFTCSCVDNYVLDIDGHSCDVTCASQGLSPGCCYPEEQCQAAGSCFCDASCFGRGDCCPDAVVDCGSYTEIITGGDNDGSVVLVVE